MNYGGLPNYPMPWTPWATIFLWKPRRIEGRLYWLRKVHIRSRRTGWGDGGLNFPIEYQYAFDIFELVKKDNEKV